LAQRVPAAQVGVLMIGPLIDLRSIWRVGWDRVGVCLFQQSWQDHHATEADAKASLWKLKLTHYLRAYEVGLSRRQRHSGTAWKCADTNSNPCPRHFECYGDVSTVTLAAYR